MRLSDHYDWIVIGDEPAALLTASMVAKMGLSVLCLPLVPGMKFSVSSTGQCFDPESNLVVGLGGMDGTPGLVANQIVKLGVLGQEEFERNVSPVWPQILSPTIRLLLKNGEVDLAAEFEREFGPLRQFPDGLSFLKKVELEFLSFWNDLPTRLAKLEKQTGFSRFLGPTRKSACSAREMRNLYSRRITSGFQMGGKLGVMAQPDAKFSTVLKEDRISPLVGGLLHWTTSNVNADPEIYQLANIWSLSRIGASFKGGMTAYREFLIDLARRMGAHIPLNTECKRIFVEQGRFAGVQVSNRGSMISAVGGILGCSLRKAHPIMTYTGRSWLHKKKKTPAPVGWKFTLALTVHEESIPVGMMTRLIWQEKDAPPLEIERVNPDDYKVDYHVGSKEHRIVYLRTVLPFEAKSLELEYQRLIAARMLRKAVELMPFLEFHVTRLYPEFRVTGKQRALFHLPKRAGQKDQDSAESEQDIPQELKEVYGFSSLDAIPENLLVYDGRNRGVGFESGIRGLLVASDESYPRWGGFGATVAALQSVSWFTDRMGINRPVV